MEILIGNTGLIGQTLKEQILFDFEFNSKNINEFNDLIVDGCNLWLSCLPATKWMVNQHIEKDIDNINSIINVLKKKKYNKIFLISTIDVYCDSPSGSDEDYFPNIKNLNYGSNRLFFEFLIKNITKYNDLKIFRLPALFGKKIKKNVLYDLINSNNISSINTNSLYQWYNLDYLYSDIINLSSNNPSEEIFNLFTEPIDTIDIVNLFPQHVNSVKHLNQKIEYNYKTKFGKLGYLYNKEKMIYDIIKFINEFSIK